jgi:nitrogenase molybdenum-cofactor synthesis protein NifE
MKNLWRSIPPFLSDTFGLLDTINNTDGLAVIDDSSGYHSTAGYNAGQSRMICSNVRMADVITGTRQKILDVYDNEGTRIDHEFVLLSAAPGSSMIGTDLDDAADEISRKGGKPAAALKTSGHKTYDNGISQAQETMSKLLLTEAAPKIENSVNIIGENGIDHPGTASEQLLSFAEAELKKRGLELLTVWCKNSTAENLKKASSATANLVTTVSGIAAAKDMKKRFAIPYVAAAPLGKSWSKLVCDALVSGTVPVAESSDNSGKRVLIIGEQLTSNAIRATLRLDYGISDVTCASFFSMDKSLMEDGDKRMRYEDDVKTLIKEGGYDIIIGDEYFEVLSHDDAKFVSLPSKAFIVPSSSDEVPALAGDELNHWLDSVL